MGSARGPLHPVVPVTRSFEDQCAWLAAHAAGSTVAELCRVTWRTVTVIVSRVVADARGSRDLLDGLRRIGIDELAHHRDKRYITVVVDHDTGRLVWAAGLTHVSADGAQWIHTVVARRAPQAVIALDPFHVAKCATDALDAVRSDMRNDLCRSGNTAAAARLEGTRRALLKNPHRLTGAQRGGLARVQRTNARSEDTNTHLRIRTRRSYWFHSPDALIAMATLTRGGLRPPLPGRAA